MKNLTGYLKINGNDIWTQYKAFLCELSELAHDNMDELMKTPKMKAYTVVSFRERNGEDLPDVLPSPQYEAIDRTLQFCVLGSTATERYANYSAFMQTLKNGWQTLTVKDIRSYKMYFQEQVSISWYDDKQTPACVFQIKFREPKPGEV